MNNTNRKMRQKGIDMKQTLSTCLLLCSLLAWMPAQAQDTHAADVIKQLDIFHQIYQTLDAYYVDTLDAERLVTTGIDAMLETLDPYTEYYTEEDQSDLKMLTQAKYGGIGSMIRMMKDSTIIIAEPYEGMPAAEVGLQAGDVLLRIDKTDLKGKTTAQVSDMLRGEPGTTFVLQYQRPGEQKPREVKITRQNIKLPPVPYYGMIGQSGYIHLNQFTNDCYTDVRRALISLKEQGATSYIFDLRGNGGGALDQAVKIVNLFVPKGLKIVETKGKVDGIHSIYTTQENPLDTITPLIVLVNGSSASASEIVAGSLQDLDRAVILGARTYGKGLVQSIRDLPYNTSLKLTTAKYYIPSGRCIQEVDYKQKRNSSQTDGGGNEASADTVFHTAGGRVVISGRGIRPDVEVHHDTLQNIVYYLSNDDVLIRYGTQYVQTHPRPASVQEFSITDQDFSEFRQMIIDADFSYDRLSDRRLQDLKKTAQFEGYYDDAKAEFEALEAKLTHNLAAEIDRHEKDIRQLMAMEIVKRYFFEAGTIQEGLKQDVDLERAQEILANPAEYNKILGK